MQFMGLMLGGGIAILWGTADSFAALSTRRLTSFATTFIAHITGLITLCITAIFYSLYSAHGFAISSTGLLIGACTGLLTIIGYLATYRSLELGPIAITSPIASTSSIVTLLLSIVFLKEHITVPECLALGISIMGILVSALDIQELRISLQGNRKKALFSKGVAWACVTPLAFGLVDLGIGIMAPIDGWFNSTLLTFGFSSLILLLLLIIRSRRPSETRTAVLRMQSMIHNPIGVFFAMGTGVLECLALMTFGMATQNSHPGMISAIASNHSLIPILLGVFILREQLMINQKMGIGMVLCGITTLTLLRI